MSCFFVESPAFSEKMSGFYNNPSGNPTRGASAPYHFMTITFVLLVYKIHLVVCQCLILYLRAFNSNFPPPANSVRAITTIVHISTAPASWLCLVPFKI